MRSGDVFASILFACVLMLAAPQEAAASDAPLVVDSAGSAAPTLPAAAPWQEIHAGDRVRLTNDRGAVFYGTVTRVRGNVASPRPDRLGGSRTRRACMEFSRMGLE